MGLEGHGVASKIRFKTKYHEGSRVEHWLNNMMSVEFEIPRSNLNGPMCQTLTNPLRIVEEEGFFNLPSMF